MTTEHINITETRFNFFLETNALNADYLTPKMILADLFWRVKMCKETTFGGEDVVNVFLECSPGSSTLKWACEAKATISLCPITPNQEPYRKTLAKTTFTENSPSVGCVAFAKWTEFKRYELNGIICVDVHLSANPAKEHITSEIEQTATKFRFTVENMSKLSRKSSPEVTVQGTNWYVVLKKDDGSLSVFLYIKRNIFNENWFWKVKWSLKLLSFCAGAETPPICKQFSHIYGYKTESWGFMKFIAWNDLMNPAKKYVQDDKAMFDIDLEVDSPTPLWRMDLNRAKHNNQIQECSVCLQNVIGRKPAVTKCGHLFCSDCIKQSIEEHKKCPMCNANANLADLRVVYMSK